MMVVVARPISADLPPNFRTLIDRFRYMPSQVTTLVAQLEDDIRRRGLRPGDRYLTAIEVGKLLDVSPMTANRAMKILADRALLVRHRSRGTFVGPGAAPAEVEPHPFDAVHLLIALDYRQSALGSSDSLVEAFTEALPGAAVELHFIPEQSALRYTTILLERFSAESAPSSHGIVLVRCSRSVQALVADATIPAVVYGQAYNGIALSSLEHDQSAIGRQMASYALERGRRTFAIITHSRWRRGDNLMLDAVTETLAQSEIGIGDLQIRSILPDQDAVREAFHEIFDAKSPPTALLCRSDHFATIGCQVISELGLKLGIDVDVISGGQDQAGMAQPFARLVSTQTIRQQARGLADLLLRAGKQEPPQRINIPVQLELPARRAM